MEGQNVYAIGECGGSEMKCRRRCRHAFAVFVI